jgi:ABC-type xylose transport system substrate-binding protein
MATLTKALFRGAATTNTATTLYTVPSSTTTVVTSVVVANTSASAGTFTLALGGTAFATTIAVGGNDSTVIDIKQVLTAAQTITGGASATTINFHISGVEVS